jgi:hypothetical protein
MPYQLPADGQDPMYVMYNFTQGKYDRDRLRLYRVLPDRDTVVEFVKGATPGKDNADADPLFKFVPGEAFFLTTHFSEDNNMQFTVRNASAAPVNAGERGYVLKNAARDGWYVLSLPFLGKISLNVLEQASSLKPDTLRPELRNRIYLASKHGDTLVTWENMRDTLTATDYGQSFAVYLYNGEKLVAPVLSDDDLLSRGPVVPKTHGPVEAAWGAAVSVSDGAGRVLDGGNLAGLAGSAEILRDLPVLNTQGINLALMQKGAGQPLCRAIQKRDGKGKAWTVLLSNSGNAEGGYILNFGGITQNLPDGWKVYLDDHEGRYARDLIKAGGRYGVYLKARAGARFKLLAGDADFIAKNISGEEPLSFGLHQNYPNPFNPVTTIRLSIPDFTHRMDIAGTRVVLSVFGIDGRRVATLIDDVARPGYRLVQWNGCSQNNRSVASGVYLYRTVISDRTGKEIYTHTRKMILAK